jgi:hypothetical protein
MTTRDLEIQRLLDEIELLHTAAREDERDMKQLKRELEEAQFRATKAERKSEEDQRYVQQLRDELQTTSHLRFKAQTEAKQLQGAAASLADVTEERDLLAKQAEADAALIRRLQHELDETAYARDRALQRAAEATEATAEMTAQVEVLELHAAQLRTSNAALAQRLADRESEMTKFETEEIGDWFVRNNGRKDQQKLADMRARQGLLPPLDSPAKPAAASAAPLPKSSYPEPSATAPAPRGAGRPRDHSALAAGAAMGIGRYEVLESTLMTATGMTHVAPGLSDTIASDSSVGGGGGTAGQGGTFSTVRSLRRSRDGPLLSRPSTAPLEIEAIYGEKGQGEDRMYLVKFLAVEAEQWLTASEVGACPALIAWRASKQLDRRYAAN